MQVNFDTSGRLNLYFWSLDHVFCVVLDIKLELVDCDSKRLAQYVHAALLRQSEKGTASRTSWPT
jgi:hypothetical protein